MKNIAILTRPSDFLPKETVLALVNELLRRKNSNVYIFDSTDHVSSSIVNVSQVVNPVSYDSRLDLIRNKEKYDLFNFDAVLLRKDPPVDSSFKHMLDILQNLENDVIVLNSPTGIKKMATKAYLENFISLMPKTHFVHNIPDAIDAIKDIGNCVIKQSDGSRGLQVKHIKFENNNFYLYSGCRTKSLVGERVVSGLCSQYITQSRDNTLLVVKYLDSVESIGSEKRVLVLDGTTILGGYSYLQDFNSHDKQTRRAFYDNKTLRGSSEWILSEIGPHLVRNNIQVAGLDLLNENGVDRLSEVNVLVPGGFTMTDKYNPENKSIEKLVDSLERRMEQKYTKRILA